MGMLAVLGLAAAFVVAGCGGGEGGGEGGGSPTATIVSDLPLQGSSRGQQETVVNAITLALEERDYMAGDVQIEYISQDDATAQAGKWDEARCAENAQGAAQDEEIVGWIGPYNSGCASRADQAGRRARRTRKVLPYRSAQLHSSDRSRR
jgi:branched-chain amino acid transport system substrate-binding protein